MSREILTYDEYINNKKIGILQKLKYCPFFKGAEQKLKSLFSAMPNESEAIKKAFEIDNKEHFNILVTNFHNSLLMILTDHLIRTLGWLVKYDGNWHKSDYNSLLQWYVDEYGIQNQASDLIVLRECMDYAQAFVNASNKIEGVFVDLIQNGVPPDDLKIPNDIVKKYISSKPSPRDSKLKNFVELIGRIRDANKQQNSDDIDIVFEKIISEHSKNIWVSLYREQVQEQMCLFSIERSELKRINESAKKVREFRNIWSHGQKKNYLGENQIDNLISIFEDSYRFIIAQYEGLYIWYSDPQNNKIRIE